MFSVPNKKSKGPRDRSKDRQYSSFVNHNNSVGQAVHPMTLSNNTSQDMNLHQIIPLGVAANQAQNRRNANVANNNTHTQQSNSHSLKGQVRQSKNAGGSGKGPRTLNSAKETQIVSGNNSKISTPGQHLISVGGIQNQKAKSSVLDQIVQMQSVQLQQQNNNLNTVSLSQQMNHQQISQRRGTTPVRPAAKNQLTQISNVQNAIHGSGGLPMNQMVGGTANGGSHKVNNRGKQQFSSSINQQKKQKLAADQQQQINRLMAAANAHAQANPNIQKQLKNQNLFPPNASGQMPSNQMLLATLQGTDGIETKQYLSNIPANKSITDHMNDMKRPGADSAAHYKYHTDPQQMQDNVMISDENLIQQAQIGTNYDINGIPAQRQSNDLNEMYIQDNNGLKLFDPVTEDPTPDHMAARTSSEYVNTDEEDEVDAIEGSTAEKLQEAFDSQNQYKQHNMHPLKQSNKNSKNTKMKSDDRKQMGRQVLQNDLEVAQANQMLLQKEYNYVAEKDFNGSGSQSRKKSRSQNKRGDTHQVFQTQVFQNNSITGGNAYNANGKNGAQKGSGARNRGQSVSHAQNTSLPGNHGASRQGKQSASIDRKLELKHQKSQQTSKNLKNNLSQPNNVQKIAQETKSLKTIQYNPIGLNIGAGGVNQMQNQIVSPQPIPSQNLMFKQQQQQMEEEVQQQVLQHLSKVEQIQVQLSRRVDIFEEEIIKRVREIQKYSKGLNQVVRKNVIPKQEDQEKKLELIEAKVDAAAATKETHQAQAPQPELEQEKEQRSQINEQALIDVQEQMEKLFRIFEQQSLEIQQLQEQQEQNDPNISEKMQELLAQHEQLGQQMQEQQEYRNEQDNVIQQIQEKLGEQTQLISIFDDQITNQEEKLDGMVKSQNELGEQMVQLAQTVEDSANQRTASPAKKEPASPEVADITQQCLDALLNSEQMQKLQHHEEYLQQVDDKFKEFEINILKISEDAEGRDGLILQQNQDITNLFQANEQILGNEKTFKDHYEKLEGQLQELITQIEEADWQNGSQVEQRVQQLLLQQQPQKSQQSARSDSSNKQMDQLRQTMETRIMLSIETLKREISVTMAQNSSQVNQSLEALQKTLESHDLVVQKVPQTENEMAILQDQVQNLELQMQAQFDEWVTEQDKSLQDKFGQINEILMEQQSNDYVSREVISKLQQELESQIAETQANVDKVILMQQTNVNPLHAKIEDLQIEIGQKVIEMSTQQDQQIAQLVEEIKQISENLENMQEIVVQNTNEAQAFKSETSNQIQLLAQQASAAESQPRLSQEVEAQIQNLSQQLMDVAAEVKETKLGQNDVAELQSDITEIKIEMQKLKQTIQQQQKQNNNHVQMPAPTAPAAVDEKTQKEVAELKQLFKNLEEDVAGQGHQLRQQLELINQKDGDAQLIAAKLPQMEENMLQLQQNIESLQSQTDEQVDKLEVRVDELISEIRSKQMQMDKMQKTVKEIQGNDEQSQQDLLTMKNIVSYLQDSNYQAQIDALKADLQQSIQNGLQVQPRYSLPEPMKSQGGPISSRDSQPVVTEIETVVMKKAPKKAQEVRSSNPAARKQNVMQDSNEKSPKAASKNKQDLHLDLKANQEGPSEQPKDVIEINDNVQARRLELSPIVKDPLLASSRDGRDTERDNLLLQKIGLQSAKKSDQEAIERQIQQQNHIEEAIPSSNVIKQLEERFDVNLDDMDDIVPDALEKDFMDAKERSKGDNPLERPSNKIERPSDASLPDFIHDKEEMEEEQYSDDFETVEKPKEIDLIIADRTNKYVEYSASAALTLSGIQLNEMSTDQLTEAVMQLINFEQLIDTEVDDLSSVINRF